MDIVDKIDTQVMTLVLNALGADRGYTVEEAAGIRLMSTNTVEMTRSWREQSRTTGETLVYEVVTTVEVQTVKRPVSRTGIL